MPVLSSLWYLQPSSAGSSLKIFKAPSLPFIHPYSSPGPPGPLSSLQCQQPCLDPAGDTDFALRGVVMTVRMYNLILGCASWSKLWPRFLTAWCVNPQGHEALSQAASPVLPGSQVEKGPWPHEGFFYNLLGLQCLIKE